jgi:hypothetical protein
MHQEQGMRQAGRDTSASGDGVKGNWHMILGHPCDVCEAYRGSSGTDPSRPWEMHVRHVWQLLAGNKSAKGVRRGQSRRVGRQLLPVYRVSQT